MFKWAVVTGIIWETMIFDDRLLAQWTVTVIGVVIAMACYREAENYYESP